MKEDLKFYYITNEINNNNINFLAHLRIGDGGYDYYLLNIHLTNPIKYNISKIPNIFTYATNNNIKLNKLSNNNIELIKLLTEILLKYIENNNFELTKKK